MQFSGFVITGVSDGRVSGGNISRIYVLLCILVFQTHILLVSADCTKLNFFILVLQLFLTTQCLFVASIVILRDSFHPNFFSTVIPYHLGLCMGGPMTRVTALRTPELCWLRGSKLGGPTKFDISHKVQDQIN